MFQTIVIIILIVIIVYLILDKKNVKLDDVKSFLKNLFNKIKEKSIVLFNKLKHFFNGLREQMKAYLEKVKQQKSEEKLRTEFKRMETEAKMAGNINNQEKVIVVKKKRFFQYLTMLNFNYLCRTVCL